jgi:anti-anti-sigma factor
MAPLLQSATTPSDGHAIVTVRGDIDADTAAQLWQYLGYLIGQGHHHIVLDLRGMLLIDSVGVDVLTRASAWTRRKGGELVLRSASPALGRAAAAGPPRRGPPASSLSSRRLAPPRPGHHDREDRVPVIRA